MNKRNWELEIILHEDTHRILQLTALIPRSNKWRAPNKATGGTHEENWQQSFVEREMVFVDEDDWHDYDEEDNSSFQNKYGNGKSVYVDGIIYRNPYDAKVRKRMKEVIRP